MERSRDVIIIGAGIGGLATGCYLQMHGYRTHILELANQCGGLCVSWKRKGYTFDGATNYLPGSSPKLNAHHIIAEIIDFSRLQIYDYKEFIRVEHAGQTLRVFTDMDRLTDEMLRIAPEDSRAIREFTAAARRFGTFSLPFEKAPELFTVMDALRFVVRNAGLIVFRRKWGGLSIREFAARLTNPTLRAMFQQIFPHHEHFAVMASMAPLGWMNAGVAGYPMGGSAGITGLAEERYRSLGGTVEFFKRVTSICTEKNRVVGVDCEDGTHYAAPTVVSAGDLHDTVYGLLGGTYGAKNARKVFTDYLPFTSLVQVSLGIRRRFEGEAEKLNTPLPEPLALGSHVATDMMVRICGFDPSFAPPGCTSVVVQLRTEDHQFWVDLRRRDRTAYRAEKGRVATAIVAALESRFGGVAGNLDVVDVATPATYIRYTNVWHGAHQGWAPTPGLIGRPMRKSLRGLEGLYLAGQWLSPAGGIPAAIAIARQVTQIICRRDGRPFAPSRADAGR